jgi:hypothetical protein
MGPPSRRNSSSMRKLAQFNDYHIFLAGRSLYSMSISVLFIMGLSCVHPLCLRMSLRKGAFYTCNWKQEALRIVCGHCKSDELVLAPTRNRKHIITTFHVATGRLSTCRPCRRCRCAQAGQIPLRSSYQSGFPLVLAVFASLPVLGHQLHPQSTTWSRNNNIFQFSQKCQSGSYQLCMTSPDDMPNAR